MLVRVRGAGASASNSQALVMNLRGAKMNAKARPSASYPLQPSAVDVVGQEGRGRAAATAAALLKVLDRFTVFRMAIDTDGATAGAVWRELHNLYDISHDEDDDTDASNPIGSSSLLDMPAASAAAAPADRRILLPLHSFASAKAAATVEAKDGKPSSAPPPPSHPFVVVHLLPDAAPTAADGAPKTSPPLSMRRALTMLAFALWRFPTRASVVLVVPDATLRTDYEGVLVAAWAVASGALDALAADEAATVAGGPAVVLRSIVNALVTADVPPLQIIAASSAEAAAVTSASAAVVIVPNAEMAAAVGRGSAVVDASMWVDGEPADDDGPRFDMSAANAERMREGARENFCPCCGHCSGPHE